MSLSYPFKSYPFFKVKLNPTFSLAHSLRRATHHCYKVTLELLPGHISDSADISVHFSHSLMSNSLRPHGLQHARLPCTSTPGVYSNSCSFSWWCHPTASSSVVPFSPCLQSFPASGSFQMRQFFASGGLSIGVSASASVLPMNIQDWFPLGWIGWISFQSKGLSRVFSNTTVQNIAFMSFCFFFLQVDCEYLEGRSRVYFFTFLFSKSPVGLWSYNEYFLKLITSLSCHIFMSSFPMDL